MSESDKRVAAMTEMRYPSAGMIAEMERERCSSAVAPMTGSTPRAANLFDRCDGLRLELVEIGDIAVKITGAAARVKEEEQKLAPRCALDRVEALMLECILEAHFLGHQLNEIYMRMTGS